MRCLMEWIRRHVLHKNGYEAVLAKGEQAKRESEETREVAKRVVKKLEVYTDRRGRDSLRDLMADFHNYRERER